MKQVSSILKRSTKDDNDIENEEGEEESAYNEHFKNNVDKPGPGEFRVPSVRVRPGGGGGTGSGVAGGTLPGQKADYTGTATEQGKHDGKYFLKVPIKYFPSEAHFPAVPSRPDLLLQIFFPP